MSKHTPGPWFAENYEGYWMLQNAPGYVENSNVLDQDSLDEAESNAKLACAAPDLFEALQNIIEDELAIESISFEDYYKAKAAIEKAIG